MTAVVFVGPTLPRAEVERLLPGADVRPPVQRGDVLRAVEDGPLAMLVIDGYFESTPAVWHKELLYAMAEGINVYGSSSMGAIRAAELAPLGMIAVGEVAAEMAAGRLDDDDVVVQHASVDHGYRVLSTAMVNIRWTLRAAAADAVVSHEVAQRLDTIAKALFYPDRVLPVIMDHGRRDGLDSEALDRLARWWPRHEVDVKGADARRALVRVRDDLGSAWTAPRPRFVRTKFFEEALVDEERVHAGGGHQRASTLIDELRLDPDRYERVRDAAVRRRAMITIAEVRGYRPDQTAIDAASDELRRHLDLLEPHQVAEWLDAVGMSADDYTRLVEREAKCRWGQEHLATSRRIDMLDVVRLDPELAPLVARVGASDEALAAHGRDIGGHAAGLESDDDALLAAFVTGDPDDVPDPAVLQRLLGRLDLPDAGALAAILRRAAATRGGDEAPARP